MEIPVDHMGPDNERHLPNLAKGVGIIVAAWGNDGNFERSDIRVMGLPAGFDVYALALTKSGCSKHSLYVKGPTKPILWRSERGLNSTAPSE